MVTLHEVQEMGEEQDGLDICEPVYQSVDFFLILYQRFHLPSLPSSPS